MLFKSLISKTFPGYLLVPVLLASLLPTGAQAVNYSPYAFAGFDYEDNLFRVANDNESLTVLGDDDPSETIYQAGVGIEGELKLSRQSVIYDAHLYRSIYSNFSELDHNGAAIKVKADYAIGRLLFGKVAYRFSRELSNFEQFQALEKSIKERNQLDIDLKWRLTTRVNALIGTGYKVVDFDDRTASNGKNEVNRRVNDYFAGLEYLTPLKNSIGIKFKHGLTRFPDRDTSPEFEKDNEYQENGVDVFTDWNISAHSELKGSVGYLDREQENFSSGNFSGLVASLMYIWKPRPQLLVNTSVRRDLSSLEGEALNYAVVKGFTIEPIWSVTSKVQVSFAYTHEKRDFRGISNLDVGIESSTRKNTRDNYRLGVNYQPRRYMDIDMYYGGGERDSTDNLRDFDYNSFGANLTFNFR